MITHNCIFLSNQRMERAAKKRKLEKEKAEEV